MYDENTNIHTHDDLRSTCTCSLYSYTLPISHVQHNQTTAILSYQYEIETLSGD